MKLDLYTSSKVKGYNATAEYADGIVVVMKGSRINIHPAASFKPKGEVKALLEDSKIVDKNGILLADVTFKSLSTAANFVTGRIANGMIAWKTADGKYVRYSLKPVK